MMMMNIINIEVVVCSVLIREMFTNLNFPILLTMSPGTRVDDERLVSTLELVNGADIHVASERPLHQRHLVPVRSYHAYI
jgi:hypothetical protein